MIIEVFPGDLVLYISTAGDKMWGIVGKRRPKTKFEAHYYVFWAGGRAYPYPVGQIAQWKEQAENA